MTTRFYSKAVSVALGALMLSSCVAYDGYAYGSDYDGYYDNYYGPYTQGYWASDGYFWYYGPDRVYHRDDAHHFQHQRFTGSVRVRGERGWTHNRPPAGSPNGPPRRGH